MADDIKQVLVMRKDLNMRKGKMVAQGAHASIAFLTNKMTTAQFGGVDEDDRDNYRVGASCFLTHAEEAWVNGRFTKICVSVASEEELLAVHQEALDAGLTSHLITDAGLTEFKEPTRTCLAIGPDLSEKIDPITGSLPLL